MIIRDLILQETQRWSNNYKGFEIKEEAIAGCLKEGQVCSDFEDTAMDGEGGVFVPNCLSGAFSVVLGWRDLQI